MNPAIILVLLFFISGCSVHTGFSVSGPAPLSYTLIEENQSDSWRQFRIWITADENTTKSDIAKTLNHAVDDEISDGGCIRARAWQVSEKEYEGLISCRHIQE